ncbi:MFS transporter [Mycetocola zhujimingii]|uniref:MFS transporter n=1 Tax=Mycetocola zhujimingii TaxID=2079792 RepID=A0A2U1TF03_9MICO|nr:MFS transporter [Mycetocola zhujimingii]PWC07461.1 MFS transporter [Mycetocola zhujimingii]
MTTTPVTGTPGSSQRTAPALSGRVWTSIVLVGLVGQLAWTIENMYLNVFVYDTITDNPTVLALMVAASAVSATIATMLLGAASDRVRRRREFIAIGYVLWGLTTATFGFLSVDGIRELAAVGDAVVLTVLAVILLDCLMSVIGAGANDAAFNAWVTESTVPANRGRVDSVLAILPLLAMLIVFGALDGLTQAGDWREFFLLIGGATSLVGVVAWFLVRDPVTVTPQPGGYFSAVVAGLRPSAVRQNPTLYVTLVCLAIVGTSTQVFLPYLIIYIQRTLQIDGYAIVLGTVLVTASVLSVLGGRLIDRFGKVRSITPAVAILAAGLILMFFARDMVPVILAGIVMMTGFMLSIATLSATVRDHTPTDRVGSVQGLRMIAAVLIPMVAGPFIGAAVIVGAAETYIDLGVQKQVPSAWIFLAAAAVLVVAILPIRALIRRTAA